MTNNAQEEQNIDQDSDLSNSQDVNQFLSFKVANEEYGVEIMQVREIKGWSDTTRLPNSPSYMKGVINLRGSIIPIFDLRKRFQMGDTNPTEKNVVIILATQNKLIGILVDAVSDIIDANQEEIKSAPNVSNNIDEKFVNGLIGVNEKMVVLLNIENLFNDEDLTVIDGQEIDMSDDNKDQKNNSVGAQQDSQKENN